MSTNESRAKRLVATTRRFLRAYARLVKQQHRVMEDHSEALRRGEADHAFQGWRRTSARFDRINDKMRAHMVAVPASVRDFITQPRDDSDEPDDRMFNEVGEAMFAQVVEQMGAA